MSLCCLIEEHGNAIEADLMRYYGIDLLDFYRGDISPRRVGVLVKQLPPESALSRALNDGQIPWGNLEHLIADHWALTREIHWGRKGHKPVDHPTRVAREAKARASAKRSRLARLRSTFQNNKRKYGLG